MSYGAAAALQAAIYGRLTGAAAPAGVPVLDAVPSGGGTGTFVLIGPEDVIDQ
jgi:TP901-1 family phage major tail protein